MKRVHFTPVQLARAIGIDRPLVFQAWRRRGHMPPSWGALGRFSLREAIQVAIVVRATRIGIRDGAAWSMPMEPHLDRLEAMFHDPSAEPYDFRLDVGNGVLGFFPPVKEMLDGLRAAALTEET